MNNILVIGIGNTLRNDDGAGIAAAQKIQERYQDVDVLCVQELLPEIAEELSQYQTVVFIDASMATSRLSTRILEANCGDAPLTHFHTPASVLGLCSQLYERVPKTALLIELPVHNVDLGESLSCETACVVEESVAAFDGFYRGASQTVAEMLYS
jgi:hydrogenase maturation protease